MRDGPIIIGDGGSGAPQRAVTETAVVLGARKVFIGSTTRHVIQRTPCPVVAVRGPDG